MRRLMTLSAVFLLVFSLAAPAQAVPPPVWESNLGTGLNQTDDDCDLVPLGFNFSFYGTTYSQVWVNSNGNVTFNGCNRGWSHTNIPDGSWAIVGPLYGDLTLGSLETCTGMCSGPARIDGSWRRGTWCRSMPVPQAPSTHSRFSSMRGPTTFCSVTTVSRPTGSTGTARR